MRPAAGSENRGRAATDPRSKPSFEPDPHRAGALVMVIRTWGPLSGPIGDRDVLMIMRAQRRRRSTGRPSRGNGRLL
ncbi:hypothetical protein GCM10023321_42990 [Pseudonocardia eucalypti]|uniref:Uncharacterized protein n=1 Tax=Pseudonocardia eucalypti TaxID=648755 RepID=A0ABP9QE41_9PSEU